MLFIERSWDTPLIDTSSRSFRSIIKSLFGSTISPLFSFFGFSFIMSLLFSLLSIALFEFFLILSKLCESTLFLLLVLLFSSSAILPTSVLLSVFTTLSTSLFSASSNDFLFFPFCSLSAPSVPYEKTYQFHQSLWWKMKIGQSCRGCEVGKNLFFDSHRLGELMTWQQDQRLKLLCILVRNNFTSSQKLEPPDFCTEISTPWETYSIK